MKKKKWKKWLIGIGSALLVLVIVGYIGMNIAVSYMLKSLVPSEVASILKTIPTDDTVDQDPEGEAPVSPGEPVKESTQNGESTDLEVSNTPVQSSSASPFPTPKDQKLDYQAEVTTEKAKEVESAISLKDKLEVTTVLLKKLSATDIQLLSKLASNGLSNEDKKAAKKVIIEKLTEDEYNHLIQIAAKYGLSQGKTYKETSK